MPVGPNTQEACELLVADVFQTVADRADARGNNVMDTYLGRMADGKIHMFTPRFHTPQALERFCYQKRWKIKRLAEQVNRAEALLPEHRVSR
jgi:hypothetical protein